MILDLIFAALLLALLGYGGLYLVPAISGEPRTSSKVLLLITLLPVATVLVLSVIERWVPAAGPRKSLRAWFLHLQIFIFYLFLAGIAGALLTMGYASVAHHLGLKVGFIDIRFVGGTDLLKSLVAAWISFALIFDFFFYWLHRACHTVPVLWAHHKMHHMDKELDALTYLRQNWIEAFISAAFITLPMAVFFKVDPVHPWELGIIGGATVVVFRTFLALGHMNVRLQVGRASLFYCSPQVHRIHHSCLPQHRDKNFAFGLPLWDLLFGTYYAPAWNEFPPTGVEGEKEISSFWESQIFTQREWWRMFSAWRKQVRAARKAA